MLFASQVQNELNSRWWRWSENKMDVFGGVWKAWYLKSGLKKHNWNSHFSIFNLKNINNWG